MSERMAELVDLLERLRKASDELMALAGTAEFPESLRLVAKRSGVQLAISYTEEAVKYAELALSEVGLMAEVFNKKRSAQLTNEFATAIRYGDQAAAQQAMASMNAGDTAFALACLARMLFHAIPDDAQWLDMMARGVAITEVLG